MATCCGVMNAGHLSGDSRSGNGTHPRLSLLLVVALHGAALALLLFSPATRAPIAPGLPITTVAIPAPPPPPEEDGAPPAPVLAEIPATLPPPLIRIDPAPAPSPPAASGTGGPVAGDSGSGGNGAGRQGAGNGAGNLTVRARRIRGELYRRDFPRVKMRETPPSSVTIRLAIGIDGVPKDCAILRPSGDELRDRITCRLALQRFRYAPARDAGGNAVEDVAGWRQDWWQE